MATTDEKVTLVDAIGIAIAVLLIALAAPFIAQFAVGYLDWVWCSTHSKSQFHRYDDLGYYEYEQRCER